MRRTLWKKAAAATCVALLLGECTTRLTSGDQLRVCASTPAYLAESRPGNHASKTAPPVCRSDLTREVSDANGFVEPKFETSRKPDVFRVLLVGSATAIGLPLKRTRDCGTHLQKILNQSGVQSEVYDFSLEGSDRGSDWDYANISLVRQLASVYQPDLVLLQTKLPLIRSDSRLSKYRGYAVWHADSKAYELARAQIDYIEKQRLAIALYRSSYLVRELVNRELVSTPEWAHPYLRTFVRQGVDTVQGATPLSTIQSGNLVADLAHDLAGRRIELVLFNDASRYPGLPEVAKRFGLQAVVVPFPSEWENVESVAPRLNDAGERVLAERLFATIKELPGALRVHQE